MSAMGQKILEVQEYIVELLVSGMKIIEIEDAIAKEFGELYRGEVQNFLEAY